MTLPLGYCINMLKARSRTADSRQNNAERLRRDHKLGMDYTACGTLDRTETAGCLPEYIRGSIPESKTHPDRFVRDVERDQLDEAC